jgi:hypothetical protein
MKEKDEILIELVEKFIYRTLVFESFLEQWKTMYNANEIKGQKRMLLENPNDKVHAFDLELMDKDRNSALSVFRLSLAKGLNANDLL